MLFYQGALRGPLRARVHRRGICRERYVYSERDRSQVYVEALPLLTSGRARLLDNKRLRVQFAALERRVSAGGRDRIDHGSSGHDDLANAAAGALIEAASQSNSIPIGVSVRCIASLKAASRRTPSRYQSSRAPPY